MDCVGVVIVSHSPKVAEGAADMVRQMVGKDVPLGFCGGNPDGGLGTSVEKILAAIDAAWSGSSEMRGSSASASRARFHCAIAGWLPKA